MTQSVNLANTKRKVTKLVSLNRLVIGITIEKVLQYEMLNGRQNYWVRSVVP